MFGRAGQLALPGAAAQLGLDGVPYAPTAAADEAVSSDRSPERASHSLGTHTGFCNPAESLTESAKPASAPAQLSLDLDAWEKAPQLSMFGRLAVQRDVLQFSEWDRYAKCGWVRFKHEADVIAARRDSGSWSVGNVIRCGYPGCPWCGVSLAQQRASELGACIQTHRGRVDVDADVWMLSLTIPHFASDAASVVVEQLYSAQAALVRTREWRTFSKRWGLVGNGVRCLDAVTGGANGLHAHFHTALFPTRAGLPTSEAWGLDLDDKHRTHEWLIVHDSAERLFAPTIAEDVRALPVDLATHLRAFGVWRKLSTCSQRAREKFLADAAAPLVEAWLRCCRAAGVVIENDHAFRRTALRLTPGEDAAAYFVGWMLADEVTRSTAKDRNPLRLLDAIAAGIKGAAYTYKQFRRAVDGRQWVTGLTDLRRRLGVSDEAVEAYAEERKRRREKELEREGTPMQKKRELEIVVRAHLFAGVHRATLQVVRDGKTITLTGWDAVFAFIDEQEEKLTADTYPPIEELQRALDDYLWRQLALTSDSRTNSIESGERFDS